MCIADLSLGTAQFGSPYGITGDGATIDDAEFMSIVEAAKRLGINKIDTSQKYGTAEKRLGQLDLSGFEITTKLYVPKTKAQLKNYDPVEHLEASLRDLRLDSVKSVLIHNAHELEYELLLITLEKFSKLKSVQISERIGVSLYDTTALECDLVRRLVNVVQIPYNAFDQRLLRNNTLDLCKKSGVRVQARSIFLQGVLLVDIDNLDTYFSRWHQSFKCWAEWLAENEIAPLEGALSIAKSAIRVGVNTFVVGVQSEKQLLEIVRCYEMAKSGLEFNLPSDDLDLISPLRWPIK